MEHFDLLVVPVDLNLVEELKDLKSQNGLLADLASHPLALDYLVNCHQLPGVEHMCTIPLRFGDKILFLFAFVSDSSSKVEEDYLHLLPKLHNQIEKLEAKRIILCMQKVGGNGQAKYRATRHIVEQLGRLDYRYVNPVASIKKFPSIQCIFVGGCELGLEHGLAISKGQAVARNLCDLPANICTPSFIAEYGLSLANDYTSIDTVIVDEKEMQNLGMNVMLSVGQGSSEPSKLVVIKYCGTETEQNPVALVGKGITFDTGGNCIKQRDPMAIMKYDMGGAAAIVGTLKVVAELNLKINVVAVLACAENMVGSNATRPGDVLLSMSGKSVEVVNTDAEGRLVLCDALSYVERFNPRTVIDVATLTGATMAALGRGYSALVANNDELAKELLTAGITAKDRAWQLPLPYEELLQLQTPYADLSNMGDGSAGCIIAALFLSQFAQQYSWAHLDVSSTAKVDKPTKGSTGRPVALLVQYLLNNANK